MNRKTRPPIRIYSFFPGAVILIGYFCTFIGETPTWAGILLVDFGNSASATIGIQSGWQGFERAGDISGTSTENYSVSWQAGQVGASVWATSTLSGTVYHGFRDRGTITGSYASWSDLLGDEVKANSLNPQGPNETLHLRLSGLISGRYIITTFHHERSYDAGKIDVYVDDGLGNNRLIAAGFQQSSGASPSSIASLSFLLESDGTNPVVIRFQENSSQSGEREAVLNGFALWPAWNLPPVVRVDFGDSGSTTVGIQSNYEGFERSGNPIGTSWGIYPALFGTNGAVTVSVWATSDQQGTPTHGFRDRGPITGGAFVGLSDLLGDEVKANSIVSGSGDESLYLKLEGLPPGRYAITTYHHDQTYDLGKIDVYLSDALGEKLIASNFQQSYGASPSSIASLTFPFVSDGINPVIIRLREIAGSATDPNAVLNGFDLWIIPEPNSLVLLGIGVLGLGALWPRIRIR